MASNGKKNRGRGMFLTGLLFFPFFLCLFIISLHSHTLINETLGIVVLILSIASLALLIVGLVKCIKNRKKQTRKLKKWLKVVLIIFFSFYILGSSSLMILLYGPDESFKNWLITTAMTTMNHQYFATWFYDDEEIQRILSQNKVIESKDDTNPDLIDIKDPDFSNKVYANEYEEAVLKKDKGNDLYKIIDIKRPNLKGKLAVVYDASKVKVAVSQGMGKTLSGSYGQYLTTISKNNNAIIATNAGGFYDPNWNSTGGVPHGAVIKDGKILANNVRALGVGGIVGFTKDNKLVLSRMSAQEAVNKGIRDAVDFGPFLIVNGESSFISGNGGWGQAPRTAIGQRKDGIVLLLAIDGRQTGSIGADMNDLAKIMSDYGAYNAANMDGGTSTAMTLNHKVITNPRNGAFQAKTRPIPNAWIVVK